ncbi:MAG TPA: Hsp20/alpha crystallin family protein [Acidimicrobiales bacterium]|jgi:HSP20 family molecular chaperone IbpA
MSKSMSDRLDERQARRDGQSGESGGETLRVPVNMYESDNALVIVAPLPGVMPDDVSVTVEPGRITLAASMRSPGAKEYLLHEWHYGPFERTLDVPEGYGGDAKASFGNGQLAVSIGRGEPVGDGPLVLTPVAH